MEDNRVRYSQSEVVAYYELLNGLQPSEVTAFEGYIPHACRILDIGVGAGRTTAYLAAIARSYAGIDYSAPMIDVCRARYPNLSFFHADVRDLSRFERNAFDAVVFSFNGIDYLPSKTDRILALQEIANVMSPRGVLIFSSHNARYLLCRPELGGVHFGRALWRVVRSIGLSVRNLWCAVTRAGFYSGDYYRVEETHGGLVTHYSHPSNVAEELRAAGMELIDTIASGRRTSWLAKWWSPWIYYVARLK